MPANGRRRRVRLKSVWTPLKQTFVWRTPCLCLFGVYLAAKFRGLPSGSRLAPHLSILNFGYKITVTVPLNLPSVGPA